MQVALSLNATPVAADVAPETLLVEWLRDERGLTGTHIGCDTSQCGACTVLVDGAAVKACTILVAQADGASVVTIEGLAGADGLHPMQAAFSAHHGLQCGFCTPGMVLAAVAMVGRLGPDLAPETVRDELEGNLCRCTGYLNIVSAIVAGGRAMADAPARL